MNNAVKSKLSITAQRFCTVCLNNISSYHFRANANKLAMSLLLSASIILTGCSSKSSGPEFSEMENTQFEEMVVFVVGAKFLKSHCGNTQIPSDDQLELQVASMAQQRGWNVDNFISRENSANSKLMIASEKVYQRLIKDPNMYLPRQVAMKCKQIGETLAPLI